MKEKHSFYGEFHKGTLKVIIKKNFNARSLRAMLSQLGRLLSNTLDYDVFFELEGWRGNPDFLMNTFHSLQTPLPLPRSVTFVSSDSLPQFSMPNHSYSPSEIGIPVHYAPNYQEALRQLENLFIS
jgi:hypothetical protein